MDEKWRPECLGMRSVRNGGSQIWVLFWGCICYSGVGTLTPIDGHLNTEKYISLLDSHLWQVVAKTLEMPLGFSKMTIACVKIRLVECNTKSKQNKNLLTM